MSSSKNIEFEQTSFLSKSNSAFIEEMYSKYVEKDPTLPESWKNYFETLGEDLNLIVKEIEGPSWKKNRKKINFNKNFIKDKKLSNNEDAEKEKEMSQDDLKRATEKVQEVTNAGVARVDEVLAQKESEILEI